ncbi:MAG: phage portal protein [Gammaproteobacteria bacterium]
MGLISRLLAAVKGDELPLPRPGSVEIVPLPRKISREMESHPRPSREEKLEAFTGWVFAAVSAIVEDVGAAAWELVDKATDIPVPEEQLPPALTQPNSMAMLQDVLETSTEHLDLAGETFWRLLTDDVPGGPAHGWEIVYPNWIDDPVIVEGRLVGWDITAPGTPRKRIPASDMLWIHYPHPRHPLLAASPVESYANSHDLDMELRSYGASLLRNQAVPTVWISTEQRLDEKDADLWAHRWLDRHYRSPKFPAVLGSGGTVNVLGLSLKELGIEVIDKMSREHVLSAYAVPASRLGITETGLNRATIEGFTRNYQRNTIGVRLTRLARFINTGILPRIGVDTRRLLFRFVNPVMADQEFLLKKATELVEKGMATVNQGRVIVGDEPNPDGDVYLVSTNVDRIPAGQLVSAPPREPQQPSTRGVHIFDETRLELVTLRLAGVQGNLERQFISNLRQLFSQEQKTVIHELRANWGTISQKRLVLTDSESYAEMKDAVGNALASRSQAWADAFQTHVFNSTEAGWSLASQQITDSIDFGDIRQRGLNRARRISAQLVSGTSLTTQKELRRIIIDGVANNESLAMVSGRIRAKYDQWKGARTNSIARTETTGHVNFGSWVTAKETADRDKRPISKIWVASFNNTRDSHASSHRQERPVNERFQVGSASLRFPGDRGPADEVIKCQCTLAFRDA